MNKNYVFVLIAVVIAIILIIVFSSIFTTMTLDQIIKNKDCVALDKWDNEHMFDDNLNISPEQMSAVTSLTMECAGKALGNMFGDKSDTKQEDKYSEQITIVNNLIKDRDCRGIGKWLNENGYGGNFGFNAEEIVGVIKFDTHCQTFAQINNEGIDISNNFKD